LAEPKRDQLTVERERAVLVGVGLPDRPLDDYPEPLAELKGLATTAGALAIGAVTQKRQSPDVSTYIGRGKVEEVGTIAKANDADVVIFDNELLPAQVRSIEQRTNTKVVDRTELILDIFATRAQTHLARMQVELAQLEYLRPRLKRMWTHLERQDGGGIGSRGPGEKQLETDRRIIDKKIRDLRERLAVVQKRKEREVQARSEELRVSLVGYTNAGKSTLMRRLTGADVYVADKLFATLDTRTKVWVLPNWGKVLLSDTVGFIRNLPHDLVESFKATLAEAVHADLLLHVVDASHPQAEEQIEAVNAVLTEIGAIDKPSILVLNQIDLIPDRLPTLTRLEKLHPVTAAVSAYTGEGMEALRERVMEILGRQHVEAEIDAHVGNGRLFAQLAAHARVIDKKYDGDRAILKVSAPRRLLARIPADEATVRILNEFAEPNQNGYDAEQVDE
jgi:GTP-binding protein HflX